MRIKLFEGFLDSQEQNKLRQDINDVLVELADLGFCNDVSRFYER